MSVWVCTMSKIETFVNYELLDRVRRVKEEERLHDDDFKIDCEAQESIDLSELYRRALNFTKSQMAVVIAAALEKEPLLVFQVIAEYVIESMKGENKKNEEL